MIDRWFSIFHNDPQKAVNDLFSGRAGLGSSMRLDIPEILYQEFPAVPELEDARQKLDAALFAWFAAMRKEYARQISRLGFGVYSKRLCDCLVSVQLLGLPMFPYQLRQGLDSWLRWLTPLRLAPERDPALECWRLLAQHQEDAEHTAAWLRLAGDTRFEYLAVALLGLQRRPNNHDAQGNQVLMLVALLLHESVCWPSGAEANAHFKRRYAALRGLYPRGGPQYWQQNLEAALAVFRHLSKNKAAKELCQILMIDVSGRKASKPNRNASPTPKHEFDALLRSLKSSTQQDAPQLVERFFRNQAQNLRYAEQTGSSFFFVLTLSQQGSELLKRYTLSQKEMCRLEQLIEQGLTWEPYNPFAWMLWADWHKVRKQFRQREWILREMTRLFPDDESSRVELARRLIRRGEAHWDEAEKWLREAAERNPKNEPSRVELARLLIRRGEAHWDEAEKWLREVIKQHPDNGQAHQVFAALLAKRNQQSNAVALLEEFVARTGGNPHIIGFLERLRGGRVPDADEMLSPPDELDMEPAETEARPAEQSSIAEKGGRNDGKQEAAPQQNSMALVMEEIKHRADLQIEFWRGLAGETAASDLLRRFAEQGDTLAGFFQQWLNKDSDMAAPPNAWAWRACQLYQRKTADTDEWQRLEQDCTEKIPYTRFIRLQIEKKPEDSLLAQVDHWAERNDGDQAASPLDRYIISAHRRLAHPRTDLAKRDAVVLTVCSAAAAAAPEIISSQPTVHRCRLSCAEGATKPSPDRRNAASY